MTTGPMTITVVSPREVPLGGLRDMRVRRTLPARGRTMIGAWCFIDHYGPSAVDEMVVAPHPHTGLQTASWLFSGAITHRDSAGNHAPVRPGELNLMTAGRGISHSEVSVPGEVLHGVQLWIALPAATRHTAPGFAHYAPPEIAGAGWRGRVFLGETLGVSSPVATHTRLVGAEITLDADAVLGLDETAGFEYGVLVDRGSVRVGATPVEAAELAYLPPAAGSGAPSRLQLTAGPEGARVLLLGGEPLGEEIVMWWNFIGRSHEEVVAFRDEWQAQVAGGSGRFGEVGGDRPPLIPAPELPHVRLKGRR